MLSYPLKCRKNLESKNPIVVKTKKENQCFYQNVQCVKIKKKIFIKEQKFNGLLIGSGIKTSLDKTPIFGIK